MDWQYVWQVLPRFVDAAYLTLQLAFWGILFSLLIGFFCALLRFYPVRFFTSLSKVYVEIARNTPLLIQLFFLYFGLAKLGIRWDGFTCGVIGLSFLGGSYMAEAFRGGLEAVRKGQLESALALGLRPMQAFFYVIFPQSLAIATPAIGANALFLLKETSIVSAIAVAELMFMAKEVIGMDYKTNEALFLLVAFYVVLLLPLSLLLAFLEKRLRNAAYGV